MSWRGSIRFKLISASMPEFPQTPLFKKELLDYLSQETKNKLNKKKKKTYILKQKSDLPHKVPSGYYINSLKSKQHFI